MKAFLELLNSLGGWDWCIRAYDGYALEFCSGTSIDYSRPAARFSGVSYISCANEFSHPQFRLATENERNKVAKVAPITSEEFVIVIEAETMASMETQKFILVAETGALMDSAPPAKFASPHPI